MESEAPRAPAPAPTRARLCAGPECARLSPSSAARLLCLMSPLGEWPFVAVPATLLCWALSGLVSRPPSELLGQWEAPGPGLPFLPFAGLSRFSGRHTHHLYTWMEDEAASFSVAFCPGCPPPSCPSSSCGTSLHHCLLPLVLLPLQTGSCFLIQSSKQNPLLSVLLPPHPPARLPPTPPLLLGPRRPGLGKVQGPLLVLTPGWWLMPTLGLSSRTGLCAGYIGLLQRELPALSDPSCPGLSPQSLTRCCWSPGF